jgi:transcription termination factor NusB
MFEDLIKDKPEKEKPEKIDKDHFIKILSDNVRQKQKIIDDLISELTKKQVTIDGMRKEIDYLTDL